MQALSTILPAIIGALAIAALILGSQGSPAPVPVPVKPNDRRRRR